MKKILITGANGQLGSELKVLAEKYPEYEWIYTDREELDLCNLTKLETELDDINPQIIINCAAHTAVDRAESELELSDILNHKCVEILAKWSAANGCQFIHVSTDYVFDGTSAIALTEEAAVNPINVYGKTKLAGENACLENNPDAIVIRTSWVYSSYGANFVKTMSRLMQERDALSIVNDQIGSPTYAADLAQAIMVILTSSNWKPGIYNFSNEGEISWYEFALAIQEIGGFKCGISGIPSSAYPTPATRPAYSLLDKSKIKNVYEVAVPYYKDSLKKCMQLLNNVT
ncbi:dTDP-4-dehydrorhamnose reductase [Flavobacterium sp. TMP13]|uniref:dTDP-4-dehydrorhamnose reductase n=1 Tax=Flavobacterium sp. TMP13 TaxID=3425950 RepID=UPI003D780F4D